MAIIKSLFRVLLVLVLSKSGASALNIADIGVIILIDGAGTYNLTCNQSTAEVISADLNAALQSYTNSYNGVENTNSQVADTGSHRKLPSCSQLCAGFKPGHCQIVYPQCPGWRRQLASGHHEQGITTGLRGSDRNLMLSSSMTTALNQTVLSNGYFAGYTVSDDNARQYCIDLKAQVASELYTIPNKLGLLGTCNSLFRKSFKLGCVYMK